MAVTVLIVDDHPTFRTAARRLLEAGGMSVIGEAGDLATAREAIRDLRPRLVLLDVHLPDGDGIAASASICEGVEGTAVVLVSSRERAAFGTSIDESGARGFILKSELTAAGLLALLEG